MKTRNESEEGVDDMDSFIPALLQTVERSGDVVEFLKTNFKGTVVPADLSDDPPLSDMEDQQKKLSVNCELFETIINLVENASISARQADECVEFLIEKVWKHTPSSLLSSSLLSSPLLSNL